MAYGTFNSEDIVLSSEIISSPIWTGDRNTVYGPRATNPSLITGSQATGLSSAFYIDVYNSTGSGTITDPVESRVQFSIAYADKDGSGSLNYNQGADGYSPSRTTFGQYRSLVLGNEDADFYFGKNNTTTSSSYFWAISIDRARYKEQLQVGSLRLTLSNTSGDPTVILKDNSSATSSVTYLDSGRVYELSRLNDGSDTNSWGYFLPDIGVILLDGYRIVTSSLLATKYNAPTIRYTASTEAKVDGDGAVYDPKTNANNEILWDLIATCSLAASETVTSNYIFVRAKNSEYNYSVNPSNITGSGELRYDVMINSPETFITTVGLYNDNNDLLAVAKLSKPLSKTFNKEALIRIKLDY